MENIEKRFFPHSEVTIDGQLFACRCRCAFIQYMLQKPSSTFGIEFWLLCDVMTSYVLKAIPYLDEENRPNDVGGAEHVVMTLMEVCLKTGLNVKSDNFFTSLTTARKLQNSITMVETVHSNKKEIPRQLHNVPKLPI